MKAATAGQRGGVGRGLLLGLLPVLLLLLLAELLLAVLGLGGTPERLPLSRGFDPGAAYILPDADVPGGWRTQIFDGVAPEVQVPPKGQATRVLLIGGSNTQSFPAQELQRRLNLAAEGAGAAGTFEVINLGRAGYGSERAAILAAQAAVLEPDVVVIYSGHNEFVEGGFRIEIAEAAPGWLARAGESLSRLRCYRVLADALAGAGDAAGGGAPEAVMLGVGAPEGGTVDGRELSTSQLDYSETLLFYEAYERNLSDMCERFVAQDVGVVLCTVVSNDLLGPAASGYPRDMDPAERAQIGRLLKRAFELVPERFQSEMYPPLWLRVFDWGELLTSGLAEEQGRASDGRPVARLRPLLGELALAPATRGAHMSSMAGAHWPDPKLWSERTFDLLDVQASWLTGAVDADELERLGLARARFDQVLERIPDHPLALFWSGLCALRLGESGQAARRLADAGRYDRAPRRANDVTNGIVRDLAAELSVGGSLRLLDADALFRQRTPDGILGYEVLMDMCHLQPGARVVLMSDMVEPIRAVMPAR